MMSVQLCGGSVPADVLADLWALHCEKVAGIGPRDAIVAEVATTFEPVLAPLPLTAPTPPLRRHRFSLSLAAVAPEAMGTLVEAPGMVCPMLEFFRAVIEFLQRGAVVHTALRIDHTNGGLTPTPYEYLGTAMLSRLVVVAGTVVRLSSPRPICCEMSFECSTCQNVSTVDVDGPLVFPVRCLGPKKCNGHQFIPRTDLAKCRECQTIKLQEPPSQLDDARALGSGGGSGISRMVDVDLTEDLIDTCAAGDVVQVTGILATKATDGRQKAGAAHQLVIQAYAVRAAKQALRGLVLHRGPLSVPSFAEADISRFRAAAQLPFWFDVLTASICPGIIGHTSTKAALVLALAGGTPRSHTRSNLHVAVFGDPGLGKSQLLRGACAASPRGVYVSANSSSSCGLTVSLSRDSANGTTFEAGAVVHGDGGVTCIDEIDKGASEHKALLEVMEQEALSIAKAGMVFSLPVRTTVIAAGNPVGGRFQPGRSITDNLNLSTALLSRFDFVFVLADERQHAHAERRVAGKVFELHGGVGAGPSGSAMTEVRVGPNVVPDCTLHHEDLVQFIQYARSRCRPLLSDEAKAILKTAYLEMRKAFETTGDGGGGLDLPVTARQLQSLVRAAEARAKCSLADVVTAEHARFSVELIKRSRESRDSSARVPPGLAAPVVTGPGRGKKLSMRDQAAQFIRQTLAATGRDLVTRDEVIEACAASGSRNPEAMLQQLSDYGIILQQSGGRFRVKASLL